MAEKAKQVVEIRDLSKGVSCFEHIILRTSESRERVQAYLEWVLDSAGEPKPPLEDELDVELLRVRDRPPKNGRWRWSEPCRLSFVFGGFWETALDLELRPKNRLGLEIEQRILGIPFSKVFSFQFKSLLQNIMKKPRFQRLNPSFEDRQLVIDIESKFPEMRVELTKIQVVGNELLVEGGPICDQNRTLSNR